MKPLTPEERVAETLRQFELLENQELVANPDLPVPDYLQKILKFDQRQGVPSGLRWVRRASKEPKDVGDAPASVHQMSAHRPARTRSEIED